MLKDDIGTTLLTHDWNPAFRKLISSARRSLIICTPFISRDGATALAKARCNLPAIADRSLVLTNLSPRAVCAGATDPAAVANISKTLSGSRVVHLPSLHAKVYIADESQAIVTSGNLTAGGLRMNLECGLLLSDPELVSNIRAGILMYAGLGAEIGKSDLAAYCQAAGIARQAYDRQVGSASKSIQRELQHALQTADDALLKARLNGPSINAIFKKTIVYLLETCGPMATVQLNPLVKQIHPDLCDDQVDRVISGQHFGKKWKHFVRIAQQDLKRSGKIVQQDRQWRLAK